MFSLRLCSSLVYADGAAFQKGVRIPVDTPDTSAVREGLFVSQGDHGVDAHGAPRRNVAGERACRKH